MLVVCPSSALDRLCQLVLLCTQAGIAMQGFAAAQAGRDTESGRHRRARQMWLRVARAGQLYRALARGFERHRGTDETVRVGERAFCQGYEPRIALRFAAQAVERRLGVGGTSAARLRTRMSARTRLLSLSMARK